MNESITPYSKVISLIIPCRFLIVILPNHLTHPFFLSFSAGIFHANYILLGLLGSVACCWGWLKKVLSTEYPGTHSGAFALMRSSDVERRRIFMVSKRRPSIFSPSSPIYLISHSRPSNQEMISTGSMESQMWRKVSSTHSHFSVLSDARYLFFHL